MNEETLDLTHVYVLHICTRT